MDASTSGQFKEYLCGGEVGEAPPTHPSDEVTGTKGGKSICLLPLSHTKGEIELQAIAAKTSRCHEAYVTLHLPTSLSNKGSNVNFPGLRRSSRTGWTKPDAFQIDSLHGRRRQRRISNTSTPQSQIVVQATSSALRCHTAHTSRSRGQQLPVNVSVAREPPSVPTSARRRALSARESRPNREQRVAVNTRPSMSVEDSNSPLTCSQSTSESLPTLAAACGRGRRLSASRQSWEQQVTANASRSVRKPATHELPPKPSATGRRARRV